MQINSLSGFEFQRFWATRKNISRGRQRFPAVVWMKRICHKLSLTCCGSEETVPETVNGLGYSDHAYEAAKARLNKKVWGKQATGSGPCRWATKDDANKR